MNAVKSTWRQLVRRRLWPVAVLLLGALAAVPVVLARSPEAPVPPVIGADAVTSKADDAIAEPVVAEVTPEDRARRRRVLGAVNDPFRPAPAKKAKVDEPKSEAAPKSEKPDASGGIEVKLPPIGGGGGNVVVPDPTGPVAPAKLYTAGTIIVRFGGTKSEVHRYNFQTSRYADFAEQVNSYRLKDRDGTYLRDAVFDDIAVHLDTVRMAQLTALLTNSVLSADPLEREYAEPFDRLVDGILPNGRANGASKEG